MNKPWLGYLSSVLILLAGILMLSVHKFVAGIIFIIVAIASVVLQIFMNKK